MVAKLTIVVDGGARVLVDGAAVGNAPLGTPVLVDPGNHVVEASLGQRQVRREVSAGKGASLDVTLATAKAFDAAAANAINVNGKYVYLSVATVSGNDMKIYDVSDPTAPVTVGGIDVSIGVNESYASGKYLYVGMDTVSGNEFRILDLSGDRRLSPDHRGNAEKNNECDDDSRDAHERPPLCHVSCPLPIAHCRLEIELHSNLREPREQD
jgi:hypothetical protein